MIARNFSRFLLLIIQSVMAAFLSACAVGPNFHAPTAPKASRYTHSPLPKKTASTTIDKAGKSQRFVLGQTLPTEWWHLFHSVTLNHLMQQGLQQSPDIEAAKKRLEVAAQTLRAQTGNLLWPAVDLALGAQRTQFAGLQFGSLAPQNLFNVYNTQAQVSYNLDVFGGARRQVEYYKAQMDYQYYELLATYLTLTSNIATTFITIASLQAQIQATHELIQAERKILDIQKARLHDGGIAAEEVYAQETLVAQTMALLPPLEKMLSEEQHALAVLTGQLTSNKTPTHIALAELNLPGRLPVSLPSALVQQRPDIQASEALLHAMSANIGVATANLLPQINLSAYYGWVADSPGNLFIPASNIWSIGATLLQPIFHGAALLAQRRAAIAEFQQYYAQYQQTVLQAFKNVADALRAIEIDARALKINVAAEDTSHQTLTTTKSRFKLGGQDYLAVLNAQEKYLQNKINRIKAEAARFTDTAALFQALGGGWWSHITPCLNKRRSHS